MTRFHGLSASISALILALLIAAVLISSFATTLPSEVFSENSKHSGAQLTDADLYQAVIDGIAKGKSYYPLVVAEHRSRGFPLKPFFTVRAPFLANLSAWLGSSMSRAILLALVMAVSVLWWQRLKSERLPPVIHVMLTIAIAFSCGLLLIPRLPLFHESWAGLLIALSLALREPGRYVAAIFVGLLAALLRELAGAFLVLMLCFAIWEKNWREATGWLIATGLLAAFMALHSATLAEYVRADDLVSQGWNHRGGWSFYLHTVHSTTGLVFLPVFAGYAAIPMCLFGWLTLKSGLALRVAGLLLGYAFLVMAFARPANLYWSILCAPFMVAGLILAALSIQALGSNILAKNEPG